jgi:hypothetical protein
MQPCSNYTVLASTNLSEWIEIESGMLGGVMCITGRAPAEFYRVRGNPLRQ